jgi:hypothetical protein
MNKSYPKMRAFIACFPAKEIIFRQQSLKLKAGAVKKKMLKILTMQKQIDNLGTHFYNEENDIGRAELLDRLSLLAASKK